MIEMPNSEADATRHIRAMMAAPRRPVLRWTLGALILLALLMMVMT